MNTFKNTLTLLAFGSALGLSVVNASAAALETEGADWNFKSHFNLYSESSYQSQFDDFLNDTKLHLDFASFRSFLTIYAGVTVDQNSHAVPVNIYNDNQVSAYPGVSVALPQVPITVFAEFWQILNQSENRRPTYDVRLGGYIYHWEDLSKIAASNVIFNETYAEVLRSSRLEHNTYIQLWTKFGSRARLMPALSIDGFAEFRALRDQIGYYWNNFQEIGPGARLNYTFTNFAVALSANYALGSFVAGLANSYAQWKSLLVISGRI